jgi:chemotaxis protein MotB
MARRRPRQPIKHQDERWLITYADVLTLLFVLFMVLFAISEVNDGKFNVLRESLSKSLSGGIVNGGQSVISDGGGTPSATPVVDTPPGIVSPAIPGPLGITFQTASVEQALENSQLEHAKKQIEAEAQRAGVASKISATIDENGLSVRLNADPFLFDSGSATLRPGNERLLAVIARAVRKLPNPIDVQGHTDNRPIATAQILDNWDLSSDRSRAVLRALLARGVVDTRTRSIGYADTRPIAPNDSIAGRAKNRRVVILVRRLNGTPAPSTSAPFGG